MTTQTITLDQAVDHAMDCLRDATTGLTITRSNRNTGKDFVCQWFTLGPIPDCHVQATDVRYYITLFVALGNHPVVQVSLTLDPGRDTALIRDVVNFYADHYGIGGAQ